MAARVVGGKSLPAEVLAQIVEKTDGVPLFVEEMTKAVVESGSLKEVNGQYEMVGALASIAIPATLRDSLMARLDRLVNAKGIAQLGAVIGRQFSYELLQAVSKLDETMLQHELGRLVEAELVYQRGLPPQAVYVFKHALVQDTAYASLLKATRQQYHQRIAQVLAERFPETAAIQPELVAHHYTEAGLPEPAVGLWQQAGQRASECWAYMEAIAHLTTGLALIATLPDTAERALHELHGQIALGQACVATKGVASPDVEHVYSRAWELCQQVGDATQRFAVLRGLWNYYLARAQLQQARALGEQLLSVAQRQHHPALLQAAHRTLGTTVLYLGDFVTAQAHFAHGLALYEPRQRASSAFISGEHAGVPCLSYDGWNLWILGYPRQSLQRSHEALTLAEELAHPFSRVFALVTLATLHQYRQEVHVTHERAEAVITLSREQGFPQWLAKGTILRGWARARQGYTEEGLTQIRQGLAAWRSTGAEGVVPYILVLLAEAYGTIGQHQQGLTVLAEAIGLVDTTGERCWEAELYRLKGELLLQQSSHNTQQTESCFHKALDVARHQHAKSWELRAATSLTKLWQSQGKREKARQLLGDVYSWFTEGFDTADLQDAKALLDELA